MYDVSKQLEDPYYLLLKNTVEKECFNNNIKLVKLYNNGLNYESLEEKDLDGIIAIGKFSDKEINLMNEYSSNIVFCGIGLNIICLDKYNLLFILSIE